MTKISKNLMNTETETMNNKKKLVRKKALLAAAVLTAGTIGISATMAYFTDSDEVTNVFTMGDLDIGLNESDWEPTGENGDGKNLYPGYTVYKNPTVKNMTDDGNGEEPCYFRMKLSVYDEYGEMITDKDTLDLVYDMIYYDSTYTGTFDSEGQGQLIKEDRIPGYSLSELDEFPMYNPVFVLDETRSTEAVKVFNYMGTDQTGILNVDEEAALFTNVAVPVDWNQTHIKQIGDFNIVVSAECIQSKGFASQADAYTALDAEIANGTLQMVKEK